MEMEDFNITIETLRLVLRVAKLKANFEQDAVGCWYCTSHIPIESNGGYSSISYKKKQRPLHRVIYYLLHPDTDVNLIIRHKCDNAYCCNPAHLIHGTYKDNVHDMVSRGRQNNERNGVYPSGHIHHASKLSPEQIRYIRSFKRRTSTKLAKEFGVSKQTICDIRNYKSYIGEYYD